MKFVVVEIFCTIDGPVLPFFAGMCRPVVVVVECFIIEIRIQAYLVCIFSHVLDDSGTELVITGLRCVPVPEVVHQRLDEQRH